MIRRIRALIVPLAALAVVVWINAFLVHEMFTTPENARMNSMHGFWMSLAARAGSRWWRPGWWPYWDCGMPFEYTYAPLIPALTAALAKFSSIPLAFHRVSGFTYCLAPATLFIFLWRTTLRTGASFAAAIVYSLIEPATLLMPDDRFRLSSFWDARRFFLLAVWDETPHLFALGLLPLLTLFLTRSFETRRRAWYWATGATMVMMMLASAFGAMLIAITAICLAAAYQPKRWAAHLRTTAAIGAPAYLIVSPYLPPSLFAVIRADSPLHIESIWTVSSYTVPAVVVLAWIAALPIIRRASGWPLQFFALLATTTGVISLLSVYGGRHFLPQSDRYKFELEMALIAAAVLAIANQAWRVPKRVWIALLVVLISLGAEQAASMRQFARAILVPADPIGTITFRAAQWIDQNLPGQRVMMGGSLGDGWLTRFSGAPQFSGSSWPTAPNPVQQIALQTLLWRLQSNPHDGRVGITWLQAYGVDAVGVPGPDSPEYWKPFGGPKMFEGLLPVLWREQDTTIYEIPRRSRSLAHVLPADAVVRTAPGSGSELDQVKRYVNALETPGAEAILKWNDDDHAVIQAAPAPADVISVQVTYHRGWHASSAGRSIPVRKDGLGLIALAPACNGPCEIELAHDGGFEFRALRIVSPVTLAVLLGGVFLRWRRWRERRT